MKSYIICSTQRSGSTYFCKSLIQTKQFGIPKESLLYHEVSDENRLSIQDKKCKKLSFHKALELLETASSTNNVCGIKLMMSTLERILRDHKLSILKTQTIYKGLIENYSSPVFVFWQRSNKIKQAISHAYLRKTKIAHATNQKEVQKITEMKKSINLTMDEIYYDFKYIVDGETKWKLFFIQNEINPHIFVFEDFLKDKKNTFIKLSAILGVDYKYMISHNNESMRKTSSADQNQLEYQFADLLLKKHEPNLLKLYGFNIRKHYY